MRNIITAKIRPLIAGGAAAAVIAGAMLSGNNGLEGRRYTPYNDVGGILTVCDGHTGKDIIRGKKYSDSECDAFLAADLRIVAKGIDPVIQVPIPETTRAALYSFTYNVGVGAFKSSTLLKKLNAGDIPGACDQLKRWTYAAGKEWKGLITRREIEHDVCTWQTHPIQLVVEGDKVVAVETPPTPDRANWFVVAVGVIFGAMLAGIGFTLWRLRILIQTKDHEPTPNDPE